ncbi:MAG: hypothetical protein ACE361_20595 [Aureliella sp.]
MIILTVLLLLALFLSLSIGVATTVVTIPAAFLSSTAVASICKPSWKSAAVNKLAILLIPTLTVFSSVLIRLLVPVQISFGDSIFFAVPDALSAELVAFSGLTGFGTSILFMLTRIENREGKIAAEYQDRLTRDLDAIARDAR